MIDIATDIALDLSRAQREGAVKAHARKAALQLGHAWIEGESFDRRVTDRPASPCRRAIDTTERKTA